MPKVILDPGHHPDIDPGAVGNGIKEADINLDLCNRIARILPGYGISPVVIQPTVGKGVTSLQEIDKVVNEAKLHRDAALFVSLHVNSAANTAATGFESYAVSQVGHELRALIHYEVADFYRQHDFVDRGMKFQKFKVLWEVPQPACLLENLFISNARDAAKLKDPSFLEGLAAATAKGIARALGQSWKGMPVSVPEWAQTSVDWAYINGLIHDRAGSDDLYRMLVVLHRYDAQQKLK